MGVDPAFSDPLLQTPGSHVTRPAQVRNVRLGARLFVAADTFVFLAFLFAFLYLRSLNQHGLWRPPHVPGPSLALGLVTLVTIVGSAAALVWSLRALRAGAHANWRAGGGAALLLLVVAAFAQGWQLFDPGFSPYAAGGYGSVFIGFTATLLAHLVGAAYWLETILVSSRPDRSGTTTMSALYEQSASAFATFAVFLAGVEVVAFVLIYLVS